jgi:hypothetical protein
MGKRKRQSKEISDAGDEEILRVLLVYLMDIMSNRTLIGDAAVRRNWGAGSCGLWSLQKITAGVLTHKDCVIGEFLECKRDRALDLSHWKPKENTFDLHWSMPALRLALCWQHGENTFTWHEASVTSAQSVYYMLSYMWDHEPPPKPGWSQPWAQAAREKQYILLHREGHVIAVGYLVIYDWDQPPDKMESRYETLESQFQGVKRSLSDSFSRIYCILYVPPLLPFLYNGDRLKHPSNTQFDKEVTKMFRSEMKNRKWGLSTRMQNALLAPLCAPM